MKKILTVATKYNEIEEFRKSILRRRITAEEGALNDTCAQLIYYL